MTLIQASPPSLTRRPHEPRKRPMSYSQFAFDDLERDFGIIPASESLFGAVEPVHPPVWLAEVLARGSRLPLLSEKARGELIVMPVLQACRELTGDEVLIYSGVRLDVAPEKGLAGECDFILARTPPVLALRPPLLTMVEAKKGDIEMGFGQCAAQMVGARTFNEQAGIDQPVYGCITSGEVWQFLRLAGNVLTLEPKRQYIDDPASIIGMVLKCVAPFQNP